VLVLVLCGGGGGGGYGPGGGRYRGRNVQRGGQFRHVVDVAFGRGEVINPYTGSGEVEEGDQVQIVVRQHRGRLAVSSGVGGGGLRRRIGGGDFRGLDDVIGGGELMHGLVEAVEGEEEHAGVVPSEDLQRRAYPRPFVVFVFASVGVVGASGCGRGILHRSFGTTPAHRE